MPVNICKLHKTTCLFTALLYQLTCVTRWWRIQTWSLTSHGLCVQAGIGSWDSQVVTIPPVTFVYIIRTHAPNVFLCFTIPNVLNRRICYPFFSCFGYLWCLIGDLYYPSPCSHILGVSLPQTSLVHVMPDVIHPPHSSSSFCQGTSHFHLHPITFSSHLTAAVAEWLGRRTPWSCWHYGVWKVVSSIPGRGNIVGWVFHPTRWLARFSFIWICLSFQILNLFRTLSSWGSINYKPSALLL